MTHRLGLPINLVIMTQQSLIKMEADIKTPQCSENQTTDLFHKAFGKVSI